MVATVGDTMIDTSEKLPKTNLIPLASSSPHLPEAEEIVVFNHDPEDMQRWSPGFKRILASVCVIKGGHLGRWCK